MKFLTIIGAIALAVVVAQPAATAPSAEGIWYLLVPPRSHYDEEASPLEAYKIVASTPLAQWRPYGAYYSADQCETVRHRQTMTAHGRYSSSSQKYRAAIGTTLDAKQLTIKRWMAKEDSAAYSAFMASRCIQSNDPRLQAAGSR